MSHYLAIKNWNTFQHYKDRNPPWIKLQTDIFQNYEFSCLSDASKLLAICTYTLAARSKNCVIPADLDYIKRQCNIGDTVRQEHLDELINKGFLIELNNASEMLASRMQFATPETETETKAETNIFIKADEQKIEIITNAENKKMFELPTKKGDNFPIFESDVTIFKNNYPAIDVKNELEKMKLWLTDKQFPKNYFSMREFVNSWLSKAQHESENIRNFEKQGVKHYAKTGAINTKQPSPFEQAMSPNVQWAIAE